MTYSCTQQGWNGEESTRQGESLAGGVLHYAEALRRTEDREEHRKAEILMREATVDEARRRVRHIGGDVAEVVTAVSKEVPPLGSRIEGYVSIYGNNAAVSKEVPEGVTYGVRESV